MITPPSDIYGTELERTATVLVTAEDATTTLTYTVLFNVLPPNDDASLSNLYVDGETIAGFNTNTYSYMYYVAYSQTQVPIVSAVPTDSNAEVQVTHAVNLDGTQAERTSTVLVIAEDGITELIYEVVFNKMTVSDDATLSNLTVNGETVQNFHPSVVNYIVTLPFGSETPFVLGTPSHEYAEVTVNNAVDLHGTDEERTTTIEVTAEDGETIRLYSILFNVSLVGINKPEGISISLYPNPASSELIVNSTGFRFNKAERVQIINSVGKIQTANILNISEKQINISVNNLSNGLYFLVVIRDGKQFSKRFVVLK